ncbi:MAG: triose-phosphate isomerase [Hyphomicrobiales bacterium]|nr:MAG: triose-phosphate isomerase [Hyphomicrobiales bacterium]
MSTPIKPLVAGNWKMNGLATQLTEFAALVDGFSGMEDKVDCMICPPATLIAALANFSQESTIEIGGQNCHDSASGAHTGDISAEMLSDAGATSVIVGHSERRADHGETSEDVNRSARAAWRAGLVSIICIGETAEQRKQGITLDIIGEQLLGSVPDQATSSNCVIAYEPVWAIGTGLTPTAQDVADVHSFIRQSLVRRFGNEAKQMRLLYGGSVKPANAGELMGVIDVDGALVGGASLKAADFLGILNAYK